jgi:hypothetical protein
MKSRCGPVRSRDGRETASHQRVTFESASVIQWTSAPKERRFMSSGFRSCLLTGVLATSFLLVPARPGAALVEIVDVTPQYVREHPNDLAVKVEQKDEMIAFTITRKVSGHRDFSAQLTVKQAGKTLVTTSIPSADRKPGTDFDFALRPELLADSQFRLIETDPERPRTHVGYDFRLQQWGPLEILSPK